MIAWPPSSTPHAAGLRPSAPSLESPLPQQSARRGRLTVSMAKTSPKIIYYRDATAQKLIKGINTVADVVKVGLEQAVIQGRQGGPSRPTALI